MRGSLVTMRRTCGKKSCRCARGALHESLYVSQSAGGKTRLAIQASKTVSGNFSDGVWLVDLVPLHDYAVFRDRLAEIITNIHGRNAKHAGKAGPQPTPKAVPRPGAE